MYVFKAGCATYRHIYSGAREWDIVFDSNTVSAGVSAYEAEPKGKSGESIVLFRLFAVLLLATAWLGGIASGRVWAQEPLKIGLSGPFTGGSASNGAGIRDGANLAAEEINAAGGIDVGGTKRLIQFVERDDQSKNDVGVKIAQELIKEQNVIATAGFSNTGVALAS